MRNPRRYLSEADRIRAQAEAEIEVERIQVERARAQAEAEIALAADTQGIPYQNERESAVGEFFGHGEERGKIAEGYLAIGSGMNRAFGAVIDGIDDLDSWAQEKLGGKSFATDQIDRMVAQADAEAAALDRLQLRPESTGGEIVEDITRWTIGFIGAGKALKAAKLLQGAGTVATRSRGAVAGALGAFAVYEEQEANLFDALKGTPLEGLVPEFLQKDDDDGALEGRLKNAAADFLPGVAVDGLMQGLRVMRAARKAQMDEVVAESTTVSDEVARAGQMTDDEVAEAVNALPPELDDAAPTITKSMTHDGRFLLVEDDFSRRVDVLLPGSPNTMRFHIAKVPSDGMAPEIWKLEGMHVADGMRGAGLGPDAVATLAYEAQRNGAVLVGDTKMTKSAVRVFEKLRDDFGFVIRENKDFSQQGAFARVSNNGDPLFIIESLGKRPEPFNPTSIRRIQPAAAHEANFAGALKDVILSGQGGRLSRMVREVMQESGVPMDRLPNVDEGGVNAAKVVWSAFGERELDAKRIMEGASEAIQRSFDERGVGAVPVAVTQRIAKQIAADFGIQNVDALYRGVVGDGGTAARLMAAHNVLLDSLDYAASVAKKIENAGDAATPAMKAELQYAIQAYSAMHAQVRLVGSEVGRSLAILKQMRSASAQGAEAFAQRLEQLGIDPDTTDIVKKLAKQGAKARELHNELVKPWQHKVADAVMETWYNGILSGPKTLFINTYGGVMQVVNTLVERPTAALIGMGRQAYQRRMGKEVVSRTHAVDEIASWVVGGWNGLAAATRFPLSLLAKQAVHAIAHGTDSHAYKAVAKEVDEAWGTAWKTARTGQVQLGAGKGIDLDERRAIHIARTEKPTTTYQRAMNGLSYLVNPAGEVIRLPGRAIATTDQFFKTVAYEQERMAVAYREARKNVAAFQKGGQAFQQHFGGVSVEDEMKSILRNEYGQEEAWAAADKAARAQAERVTFTTELDGALKSIETASLQARFAGIPYLRLAAPFIRTPSNIFIQTFGERTLLGLASKRIRAELADPGVVGDIARARMVIGNSALVGAGLWAHAGLLKGGGSKQRTAGDLDNVPDYSIKNPVTGEWMQFNRADPWGMFLGLGADLYEATIGRDVSDPDAPNAFSAAAVAIMQNAGSKTWLTGLVALSQAFNDPDRYADSWVDRTVLSFMPFSSMFRWTEQQLDPVAREAFTLNEKWRAMMPGLSDELPLKRDWLGRPVERAHKGSTLIPFVDPTGISPLTITRESTDPVIRELASLDFPTKMPDKDIGGVQLSAEEYSRLLELRGTLRDPATGLTLHEALAALIADPQYEAMIEQDRVEAITDLVGDYGRAARNSLLDDPAHADLRNSIDARRARLITERELAEQKAASPGPMARLGQALGLSTAEAAE